MTDELKINWKTCISFGKYEGRRLQDIPASYLLWLHDQGSNYQMGLHEFLTENLDEIYTLKDEEDYDRKKEWKRI